MNVVRFHSVGLAAGLASDFHSLEGRGPQLFLTWRPALGGRDTNFMVGAGGLAALGGSTRVLPTVNASFVLY